MRWRLSAGASSASGRIGGYLFFAVRESGPSRHSLQCSIIPALGVIAAMEGGATSYEPGAHSLFGGSTRTTSPRHRENRAAHALMPPLRPYALPPTTTPRDHTRRSGTHRSRSGPGLSGRPPRHSGPAPGPGAGLPENRGSSPLARAVGDMSVRKMAALNRSFQNIRLATVNGGSSGEFRTCRIVRTQIARSAGECRSLK
jgi:hypothetical protein